MPEFECTGPVTATVRIGGGSLDVVAEERRTASVDVTPYDDTDASRFAAEHTVVELHGSDLTIAAPDTPAAWLWRPPARLRVTARIPIDSRIVLRLASARAVCQGRYAAGEISSASGDVAIDHVTGDLHARTASGEVTADRVDGDAQVRSASGQLRLGTVGRNAGTHTASGDVAIESVGGSLRAVSASGNVHVGGLRRGAARVKTASGDVHLGVVAGTALWLDLSSGSGVVHSDLATTATPTRPTGADLHVEVRTASGDIEVRRVADVGAVAAGAVATRRTR
ncbi:MAG TPA: DUF4097 family beta strand repeat-containing protein [Micromonosporaceae bacterium]|nr:DUF4097 family beta strand repeat-containing protein [Micromonosporaceae bacterium]